MSRLWQFILNILILFVSYIKMINLNKTLFNYFLFNIKISQLNICLSRENIALCKIRNERPGSTRKKEGLKKTCCPVSVYFFV